MNMAEGIEKNHALNFKKTVVAQKERVGRVEDSSTLDDSLEGMHTKGSVKANYGSRGAFVQTSIDSGTANLEQTWYFDELGKVKQVLLSKTIFDPTSGRSKTSGSLSLARDDSGRLQVEFEEVGETIGYWEKEFSAARQKLSATSNKLK